MSVSGENHIERLRREISLAPDSFQQEFDQWLVFLNKTIDDIVSWEICVDETRWARIVHVKLIFVDDSNAYNTFEIMVV